MARRWRFWRKPPPGLTPGQVFQALIKDTDPRTYSHSFDTYESDWWAEPEDHWLEFDGKRIDPGQVFYIKDLGALTDSGLRGWWRVQQWRFRCRIRAIQRLLHVH